MNFKTTIVLIVVLAVIGLVVLLLPKESQEKPDGDVTADGPKLFQVESKDITRLVIRPAEGKTMIVQKTGDNWRLVEPVDAPAEKWAIDSLLGELTGVRSRGKKNMDGQSAAAMGLDRPAFAVELHANDGRAHRMNVGRRASVGDSLYLQVEGDAQATVVSASLWEQLDKPYSKYRDSRLTNIASSDIRQVAIERKDGRMLLHRTGEDKWEMLEPQKMPADSTEVGEVLSAISFLSANEFVDEADIPTPVRPDKNSRATVWCSKEAPSTQPSAVLPTTRGAGTIIRVGGYDSILKKNVYVAVSDPAAMATVSATSVEAFNRKPLDLRDRKIVDVDPATVSSIRVITDKPATTQPTTMPASHDEMVIERRKETEKVEAGGAATTQPAPKAPATQPAAEVDGIQPALLAEVPETQPTTQPATQPATQPVIPPPPPSTWVVATTQPTDAQDSKVDDLLRKFSPLRVDKYLEAKPADMKVVAVYTVRIQTQSAGAAKSGEYEIRLTDRGEGPLIGECNGLVFEIARTFIDDITGDFKRRPPGAEPETPAMPLSPGIPPFGQ